MSLGVEKLLLKLSLGYTATPFSGKKDQIDQVLDLLDQLGFLPEPLIELEARWFYELLGIDDVFFARELPAAIADHILLLYLAKVQAFAGELVGPLIRYRQETDDLGVYFDTLGPGAADAQAKRRFEERIDDKYLDPSSSEDGVQYRAEFFTAPLNYKEDTILRGVYEKNEQIKDQMMLCAFVYKCQPDESGADATFLKTASDKTKELYGDIVEKVKTTTGPVITHFPMEDLDEYRVIIGYKQKTTRRYISALLDLANYYKLTVTRKYVEQFQDTTVISMYVTGDAAAVDLSIFQVIKEASLLYCIPYNLFQDRFVSGELSLQELIYAQCGVVFVTHFMNRLGPEYTKLLLLLDASRSLENAEVLNALKKRLRAETYSQAYIQEVFDKRRAIVQRLYRSFADVHYIKNPREKTLSYQRLSQIQPFADQDEFEALVARECAQNEHHATVLRALWTFNASILKTNFFISTKVALSFRLQPDFLPASEYPDKPYGMFFIVGSDFRGFHIRFRDISRGGIRIVRSRNLDAYLVNAMNLFDENYNLANTQQRKNKDIPEGGSKGVILLDPTAQDRAKACFDKYIDSLIDLLLKQDVPGSKEQWVDLYNKPEILFLGPDEGTAPYTDWATLHARARGAPWWKSFLTGKLPQLGGIPHDEYGMTTLSVRAYVNKIYEKLGVDNAKVRKFQTGGPDGDLGSNEILLSRDEVYVGLVDGSGVIADPNGLDKTELRRLAKERKMIEHYDRSLLSKDGYVVLVDDMDVKLPSGQVITLGVAFRNTFHLKLREQFGPHGVDLFVPCGGRPAAIDTDNVQALIDPTTSKAIVPYFVEGANLFVTQGAKLQLEKAGTLMFKDALTNKGGVTSLSLEVLASLAFDDESFLKHMCVDLVTHEKPAFYEEYVTQVQAKIVANAQAEFEALWALKELAGTPLTELSDQLSYAINKLADELLNSAELWNDDVTFRNAVLQDSLPPLLIREIGLEAILQRVPENYLKAIFATYLASKFVYTKGNDTNPAKFMEFISLLRREFKEKKLI